MKKPEDLPPKTSQDHDYLVSRGWRFIGVRRAQYGMHYYWDYHEPAGTWSSAFIQGDAVALQRKRDKEAKT